MPHDRHKYVTASMRLRQFIHHMNPHSKETIGSRSNGFCCCLLMIAVARTLTFYKLLAYAVTFSRRQQLPCWKCDRPFYIYLCTFVLLDYTWDEKNDKRAHLIIIHTQFIFFLASTICAPITFKRLIVHSPLLLLL